MQAVRPTTPMRLARIAAAAALALPLLTTATSPAYADDGSAPIAASALSGVASQIQHVGDTALQRADEIAMRANRTLSYDPALIAAIGSQQSTGHWVCCPGFSCAYGDAIINGTANSHAAYGCGCCTWPGWGGGNSSFRSLGTDQALLREAYDNIAAGKPTVIHVSGSSNEHWICLMGYRDVQDPDNLTLDNFIALDPVDGAQIIASDRYSLYGDACEHVSDAV